MDDMQSHNRATEVFLAHTGAIQIRLLLLLLLLLLLTICNLKRMWNADQDHSYQENTAASKENKWIQCLISSNYVSECSYYYYHYSWLHENLTMISMISTSISKQESFAIAKMTTRCALYMGTCPENFRESPSRPTVTFPEIFSWTFVPSDPMNVRTKFEVLRITCSWDNRGYPKNWAVPGYAHAPLSPNFLWLFARIEPANVALHKFGQSLYTPTLPFIHNF